MMGAVVSLGAATKASIAVAHKWKRMLKVRIQDSMENTLIHHAQLLVTEETVARNGRWKSLLLVGGDNKETEKIMHLLGHATRIVKTISIRPSNLRSFILDWMWQNTKRAVNRSRLYCG